MESHFPYDLTSSEPAILPRECSCLDPTAVCELHPNAKPSMPVPGFVTRDAERVELPTVKCCPTCGRMIEANRR